MIFTIFADMRTNIQTSILSVVRECIFAAGCKGKDVEREERRLGDQRKKWKRRRSRSCSSLVGLSSSGAPPPPPPPTSPPTPLPAPPPVPPPTPSPPCALQPSTLSLFGQNGRNQEEDASNEGFTYF